MSSVYAFKLDIRHGLTMSVWNSYKSTYDPVVKDATGKLFNLRNNSYKTACPLTSPLTDPAKIDSIITAAGRHREVLLINRNFPGTPIVVPLNAAVEITVTNHLMSESISLHWHGQTQMGTFYMDGVSRITQCPIGPGETYVYKFRATEIGTHWYHAHSGVQRTEGLYGPFIVTDRYEDGSSVMTDVSANYGGFDSTTDIYENEFYFIVHDWYQESSNSIFNHVLWENIKFFYGYGNLNMCFTPNRMDDGTVTPPLLFNKDYDAILINGKGSYQVMTLASKLSSVNQNLSPKAFDLGLEVFNVMPNKRYKFRVIGANAGHPLEIRVGGHKMYIIASDGNAVKVTESDSLIINGGERWDFYINTKGSSNQNNYFITVRTLEKRSYDFKPLAFDNYGLAILKYQNVSTNTAICDDACSLCEAGTRCIKVNCPFWSNTEFDPYKCIAIDDLESVEIPESDKDLLLNSYTASEFQEYFLTFHFAGSSSQRSSINGKRFVMPSIPSFLKLDADSVLIKCNRTANVTDCTHTLQLETNKVTQLILLNKGNGIDGTSHPIHLHGHHFYVVYMGYPLYDTNNYTLIEENNDTICASADCDDAKWRDESWKLGNVPIKAARPRKDTLFIPVGGYAIIRFRTNNTGYWFLHCHIEVHQGEGMALLIQEGTHDEIRKLVDRNSVNVCDKGFESNVIGESSQIVASNLLFVPIVFIVFSGL